MSTYNTLTHASDHCPYCVRVELALGWKNIPYKREVYGYGDTMGDEKKGLYFGGKSTIKRKVLPVLEIPGREPSPYMNESGTIVAFLEGLAGPTVNPQLLPSGESKCKRADLSDFLKSDGRFKVCQRILTRPLVIKMTHLKDWAKAEDVKYAVDKYEGQGWSYSDAESKKAEALVEMEKLLIDLDSMLVSDEYASRKDSYTWDDVVLVPELRTLSCAPGLKWPKRVKTYLTTALKRGGVSSYFSN